MDFEYFRGIYKNGYEEATRWLMEFTLAPLLHDIPLESYNLSHYRQDGTSDHNVRRVRSCLTELHRRKYLGTHSSIFSLFYKIAFTSFLEDGKMK